MAGELPQPNLLDKVIHLGGLRRRPPDNPYAQELIEYGISQEMQLLDTQRGETAESMLQTYSDMLTEHPSIFHMPGIGRRARDLLNRALIVSKFPATLVTVPKDNYIIHPVAKAIIEHIRSSREAGEASPLESAYHHLLNVWEEERTHRATFVAKHPERGLTPEETLLMDNQTSLLKTFAYEEGLEAIQKTLKAHLPKDLQGAEGLIDKSAQMAPLLAFFRANERELAEYIAAESADPKNEQMREEMILRARRITVNALKSAHKIK